MRSATAVIAGLVAWAVLATLFNLVLRFGLGGYGESELSYNFTLPMLVGRLGVGAFASVGAGIFCSWVAGAAASPRRRQALAAVTGALLVLSFIPVHYYMWQAFPVWYHAFFLVTLLPFVVLGERLARQRAPQGVELPATVTAAIIPFEGRFRDDFRRLNIEWLEKYFRVEPIDDAVLSRPEDIIVQGGFILLACSNSEVVGTCAVLHAGERRFELSKMAVTAACQGHGIGRQLLVAALTAFAARGGGELFLETNSALQPAIALYQSVGFRHVPRPAGPAHYARADVYMVYQPGRHAAPAPRPTGPTGTL